MEYIGIVKERKLWVKVAAVCVALAMIYLELLKKEYIYIPVILFVMVAAFFEKQHIVSEKGVDIEYHLLGMVMHNYWSWDEVTTMHPDYIKARPNVMLHIGKDIVTRSFIMTVSDANGILELAQRMNSSIYIKDIR